jgi:Transposase DDE domain group 1
MTVPQGILPFKLIADTEKSIVTSFAGLPLVVETMRALNLPEVIRTVLHIKKRESGFYSESDYVESFISLFAAGGSCLDDFARLQSDRGLKELGLSIPSPESARFFLYGFHDEELLKDRPEKGVFIPFETEPLKNLMKIQERIIEKTHDHPTVATIDEDASIFKSTKDEARPTYLGDSGYQPVVNYWAEKDMILADEFRDGNVPAAYDLLSSLLRSIEMLPDSVAEVRYRADSASYSHDLMDALRPGLTIRGRRIKAIFAISADVTESLKREIEKLPSEEWKPLRKVTGKGLIAGRKEWAEVVFVPSKGSTKKNSVPDRYLAIRVRPSQGELFSDGNAYRYYAVVTNNWTWDGERLLRWHREKCGTIEKVFDVLKNDLGAGVMPCGRFSANAAWLRLNCIAYNVISVMKRKALPDNWQPYRMKALRFFLIGVAGRIIRTGRRVILRFAGTTSVCKIFQDARRKLVALSNTA